VFDIIDLNVTAGADVAFATALMGCVVLSDENADDLDFRLTIGFRKIDGDWVFVHEHHSIPAAD
jgi:ketosteroid isomerase-like protein